MSEVSKTTIPDDAPQFSTGDVVQLKSGGPAMTFRGYSPEGNAIVQFMTHDGMKYDTLPLAMLRPSRDEREPGPAPN